MVGRMRNGSRNFQKSRQSAQSDIHDHWKKTRPSLWKAGSDDRSEKVFRLPGKVGERLVGLRHAVNVFTGRHRRSLAFKRGDEFIGQA